MLIVSTIRLMFDLSISCVPRPCLYMLGSSSQPKCFACVPRPCLYMLGSSTPVVFERLNKTPDHHVRWSSHQWWTSLCWSYLLYDSRSTFRSPCSEAISVYAWLVKFNPSILRVQNWLAPVVCEHRAYHTRSSRGVSAQRTLAMVHTQEEHFYLEI